MTPFWVISLIAIPAGGGTFGWTSEGPDGGSLRAVVAAPGSPATLYVATHINGVFKSTDGGSTWSEVNQGLVSNGARARIMSLALDPASSDTVFAGASFGGRGAFRSTDGGASWQSIDQGLDDGGTTVAVDVLAAESASVVYAGNASLGVYKTTDGGATWALASNGLVDGGGGAAGVAALAIDPSSAMTVYAGGIDGLFKTVDGAANWAPSGSGLPDPTTIRALAVDPSSSAIVYAAGSDGVFKSTDGGASWAASASGLPVSEVLSLAVDPASTNVLFAGLPDALYRSDDGAASWSEVLSGERGIAITVPGGGVFDSLSGISSEVYAATGTGFYRSTDGGSAWSAQNAGLRAHASEEVFADSGSASRLYSFDLGFAGVFRSDDGGASWASSSSGLTASGHWDASPAPSVPLSVLTSADGSQIFKTTDGGGSWSPAISDLSPFQGLVGPSIFALDVHPTDADTVMAMNWGFPGFADPAAGIFRSIDGGSTFAQVFYPSTLHTFQPESIAYDPSSPDTIYAGSLDRPTSTTRDGTVWRSTDGGNSWQAVLSDIGFPRLRVAADGTAYALGTPFLGVSGGIYRSTDGGASWDPIGAGLPATPPRLFDMTFHPDVPSTLYGTTGLEIYASTDAGSSWQAVVADGLPAEVVKRAIHAAAAMGQTNLYAGTDGGVFQLCVGGIADTLPCGIFEDGFESGNLSAWSSSVP